MVLYCCERAEIICNGDVMKNMVKNYKELVSEISNEVSEGVLNEKDMIQILRAEKAVVQDYHPIIEWYYDSFVMEEELDSSLEDMYMKDEFSEDEWDKMAKEMQAYKKQYLADQPKLIVMGVKETLTEMKQMIKLLG